MKNRRLLVRNSLEKDMAIHIRTIEEIGNETKIKYVDLTKEEAVELIKHLEMMLEG